MRYGGSPLLWPELIKFTNWGSIESFFLAELSQTIGYGGAASYLFDISSDEAYKLFTPGEKAPWLSEPLYGTITPEQVADSIEKFIAWKENS